MLLSMEYNICMLEEANVSMQFAPVIKKWQHNKKTTSNNMCGNCTKHYGNCPPHKQNGKTQHQRKTKSTMRRRDILTSLRWKNSMANMMKSMYHFVVYYPDMASDPGKIMIDDIKRPRKNRSIYHCAPSSWWWGKTTASVWVKVKTGAGGNVVPLRVFDSLYP